MAFFNEKSIDNVKQSQNLETFIILQTLTGISQFNRNDKMLTIT